ncbi:hypothetical protein SAMN02745221_00181 [Thermosyntropha lipolytica DSM 11003]|uniref:Uncharacterized protein n=2 Tax=Thermosyntropha TaxID=54293 RepID=A0A1M5JQ23_9FIRM|nr:hypothetical protein SAMN02745221_00181 [Thermosyntropha lipolytica DSM 11003]
MLKHFHCMQYIMRGRRSKKHLLLPFLLIIFMPFLGGCQSKAHDFLVIGVPDDAGGLIVEYMIANKLPGLKVEERFDMYAIKDCCSSTSAWALSSSEVNMAVICPDAAEDLIAKDERYVIVGPVLANSDLFVLGREQNIKTIGYTQNRWYQKDLIHKKWKGVRPVPLLSTALPYALEKGVVDGVVIDVSKCQGIKGTLMPVYEEGQDVITYVLVANKEVLNLKEFKEIMQAWDKAAHELNEVEKLSAFLQQNVSNGDETKGVEIEIWKKAGVKFLSPLSDQK